MEERELLRQEIALQLEQIQRDARGKGASKIEIVEDNPLISSILKKDYFDFTGGVYASSDVKIHSHGIRSYLKAFKNIHMVNNYDYAFKRACRDQSNFVNATGLTTYEYYQTGRDGLLFDCIQLIKMAKADIELKGYGWKWQCQINGWRIDRNLIDDSYYDMIEDFISDKLEQTLEALVGLFKDGKIEPVLRPTTLTEDLVEYDGDFGGLYRVAFKRTTRPRWAEEIFPVTNGDTSGFPSLVDEVNLRLSPSKIKVKNIKCGNICVY